jgi:hypothetical protein
LVLVAVSSTLNLNPSELEKSAQLISCRGTPTFTFSQHNKPRNKSELEQSARLVRSTSGWHQQPIVGLTGERPIGCLRAICNNIIEDKSVVGQSQQSSLALQHLQQAEMQQAEMRVAAVNPLPHAPADLLRLGHCVRYDRDYCVDYVDGMEIIQRRLPFPMSSIHHPNGGSNSHPEQEQRQRGSSNYGRSDSPLAGDVYESIPVDASKLLLTMPAANLLASKRLQDLKAKLSEGYDHEATSQGIMVPTLDSPVKVPMVRVLPQYRARHPAVSLASASSAWKASMHA